MQAVLPSHFRMRMLPGFSRMLWRKPGEVYYIGGADVLPNPLSPQQESAVIESLTKEDSQQARASLIEHNLRLVAHVAKKYQGCDEDPDDLISIGTIGLIKAISTFDPSRTSKLSTYAARCIDNELLMMFRARRKRSREVSLYEPIGTDREGNEISLLDIIESPPVDVVDDCFKRDSISYLLRYIRTVLSPKEYQVICCRYGLNGQEPLTQREIAENLSISRSYVSRIEKNALRKLRTLFPENQ